MANRIGLTVRTRAGTLADARQALRCSGYDLVLLDLNLPDSRDLDTLDGVVDANPEVPIVVLTSLEDHDRAVEALKCGAQDFIGKSEITAARLERVSRYAIERQGLLRRLVQKTEELDRFTAIVARDLAEPADTLNLALRWLREDHGPFFGSSAEQLRMLEEATERIGWLQRGLLGYARAAGGDLRPTPTPLHELFDSIVASLSKRVDLAMARVVIDRLPVAMVDRAELETAFRCLLEVAVSEPGLISPQVRVRGRTAGPLFVELVIDHEGRAFASSDGGQGNHEVELALTMAQRIVEAHGGHLSTRREATGSAVWITLARVPAQIARMVGSIDGVEA